MYSQCDQLLFWIPNKISRTRPQRELALFAARQHIKCVFENKLLPNGFDSNLISIWLGKFEVEKQLDQFYVQKMEKISNFLRKKIRNKRKREIQTRIMLVIDVSPTKVQSNLNLFWLTLRSTETNVHLCVCIFGRSHLQCYVSMNCVRSVWTGVNSFVFIVSSSVSFRCLFHSFCYCALIPYNECCRCVNVRL